MNLSTRAVELNNEIVQRDESGFFKLEADQKAIKAFIEDDIKKKMNFFYPAGYHRIKWLVEEGYYYNVFDFYTEEEVQHICDVAESYHFKFQSYMAISKFYSSYALKTDDKRNYLETYTDHNVIVALYLGLGDANKAEEYVRSLMEQRYQPATPTYLNAGRKKRGELVSCFLLETDDSLNSINYVEGTAQQLSKIGGGVAINLSRLRARGEDIKGIRGVAKGVVPVARKLQLGFAYADQLGERPGSGAAYLNIFHADLLDFLDTKKENADEDVRLSTLSIGLIVPDKFFELAKENKPLYLFGPHSVYKEFGEHLDDLDMSNWYDQLCSNHHIMKRKTNAREVLNLIAQMQMQSGYPYIFYRDTANQNNPLRNLGRIKMSNLCTEISQIQDVSTITDYGEPDIIRNDISCNLGSLNIVNVMEKRSIGETVKTAMRMLTTVSDLSSIKNAPGVAKANHELHSVGLGAMNLNGYFAKNKISYGSEEARDFVRTFFMIVNFYSIQESMNIAKDYNTTFKGFKQSDYANGSYFDKYLNEDFSPRTERVKELFKEIAIPVQSDWSRLKDEVQAYGLYNAYRLALAPTQSISYVQNATPSIMPIVDLIERRKYGDQFTMYPMPFLSPETMWYYKSAYHISQYKVIDLVAEIQNHVDQGISTVLFADSDTSTRELARLYVYAHVKGLKSLYYTRTKLLTPEECESCGI